MTPRRALRALLAVIAVLAGVAVAKLARRELNEPPDRTGAALPLPQDLRAPGTIADARVVRAHEPAWVRDLAGWVPGPPSSRLGRVLAYLWASPSTLVGLVTGALSATLPHVDDGVVVFAGVRGPVAMLLSRGGYAATTLGHVVLAQQQPSPALMAHEMVHTRQAERLGPLMGPVYWYLLVRYGYAHHPMERAARIAGRAAKHLEAGHTRPMKVPVRH